MKEKVSVKDMLDVLFKREFYLDMVVFVFVCITGVLIVLYFCFKVDRFFGFQPFIGSPLNYILFFLFTIIGALIVWRAYTYLVVVGEGSPCPQLGGTRKLVTVGPYAFVRHPSVIGKLFGIVGLGCLSKSVSFTFILIPILLTWSAFYNRFIQEKVCVERFGNEYLKYRKHVPLFLPRITRYKG